MADQRAYNYAEPTAEELEQLKILADAQFVGTRSLRANKLQLKSDSASDKMELQESIESEATARSAADETLTAYIATKVDKVEGKVLSSNDYTDDEKAKVADAATSAEITSAVAAEASARNTAIENAVSAEATAREDADTALSNAAELEANERYAADSALDARITALEQGGTGGGVSQEYVDNAVATEASARDTAIENAVGGESSAREAADTTLQGNIDAINAKIPTAATSTNKLADKAYVDDADAAISLELDGKVDKVDGKGLSTNDLTDTLKSNYDSAYGWGNHANAGYGSNTPVFTEASTKVNIASGETLSTLFGKIKKWFSSLGTLAFKNSLTASEVGGLASVATSGSYNDLSNKPTIPDVSNFINKTTTGDNNVKGNLFVNKDSGSSQIGASKSSSKIFLKDNGTDRTLEATDDGTNYYEILNAKINEITAPQKHFFVGTNESTTTNYLKVVNSKAGILLDADQGGEKGLYLSPVTSTSAAGKWALKADTNNNVYLYGSADNSTKWNGYKISVGTWSTAADTISFF